MLNTNKCEKLAIGKLQSLTQISLFPRRIWESDGVTNKSSSFERHRYCSCNRYKMFNNEFKILMTIYLQDQNK